MFTYKAENDITYQILVVQLEENRYCSICFICFKMTISYILIPTVNILVFWYGPYKEEDSRFSRNFANIIEVGVNYIWLKNKESCFCRFYSTKPELASLNSL